MEATSAFLYKGNRRSPIHSHTSHNCESVTLDSNTYHMPFTYMKIRARQKAIILPFGAVSVLLEMITFLLYCILSNSYNVGTLAPASGSTVYSSVSSSPPSSTAHRHLPSTQRGALAPACATGSRRPLRSTASSGTLRRSHHPRARHRTPRCSICKRC